MGEQSQTSTTGEGTGGERLAIAFLGPEGTYGQQAARQFARSLQLQGTLDWIACPTITHAFEYRARYTVLPLENTIFGPVTETFDCLFRRLNTSRSCASGSDSFPRTTSKGKEKEIVGTLDLPIRHCLVVKRGTQMSDIRWVKSHEQALGQSSRFLDEHLPRAKRMPTASTALAARSLISDHEAGGAALCSRSVVEDNDELEILYEGTQNREGNFTRFILLELGESHQAGPSALATESQRARSDFYVLPSPEQIPRLPNFASSRIGSLHSRPALSGSPQRTEARYPSNVFVEVIGHGAGTIFNREHGLSNGDNTTYVHLGSASIT